MMATQHQLVKYKENSSVNVKGQGFRHDQVQGAIQHPPIGLAFSSLLAGSSSGSYLIVANWLPAIFGLYPVLETSVP